MGSFNDTPCSSIAVKSFLTVGLSTLALLLLGAFAGPNSAVAQETPEASFPITVSTDAGGSQELSLGLDPSATAGIDTPLGEEEQPPLPPSDIFDARLIDDDIPPTGFGEGLVDDFREGSASFAGTKEHEIQIQPDSGATEATIAWELPAGVNGQLQDVITNGGLVDEPMEGSGSYTLTNLNLTKLLVTLEYSGSLNQPPEVVTEIPDDTLLTPGPPLQLTGLGQTVFSDPDGEELSFSAQSENVSVVQPLGQSPQVVLLQAQSSGQAEVTVTATDPSGGAATDTFEVTVGQRDPGAEVPAETASVVVGAADTASVGFGATGVGARFQNVQTGGAVDVSFFTAGSPPSQSFVPADSFENVSPYRWEIDGQGVDFEVVDVAFSLQDTSVVGVGDASSVFIIRGTEGSNDFETVPTTFAEADSVLVGEGLESFSTFKFASDDNPLPVELTSFTVRRDKETALVQWHTVTETNNAGFEVQRRGPGMEAYTEAGFVESKAEGGTTTEPKSYWYETAGLVLGTHHFRLRQVDIDGTGHLSKTVSVTVEMEESLRLTPPAPNPVQGSAQLRFGLREAGEATITLYNILGQRVATLYEGRPTPGEMQRVRLGSRQLSQLSSGVYFVRLRAHGKTRIQRLMRVR